MKRNPTIEDASYYKERAQELKLEIARKTERCRELRKKQKEVLSDTEYSKLEYEYLKLVSSRTTDSSNMYYHKRQFELLCKRFKLNPENV